MVYGIANITKLTIGWVGSTVFAGVGQSETSCSLVPNRLGWSSNNLYLEQD